MITNCLFHFTTKLNTVIEILKSSRFRASYCKESVANFYPEEKFAAIPMVCFCDIPLKNVSSEHTTRYGYFGIGLKKEWALINKVNPILYRINECMTDKSYNQIIRETKNNVNRIQMMLQSKSSQSHSSKQSNLNNILNSSITTLDNALKLTSHIKAYEDERLNYVDREWRWVPETSGITFCKDDDDLKKTKDKYKGNEDFLQFEIDDIEYIIVNHHADIELITSGIDKFELGDSEKYKLIQKIIDIDHINNDM